MVLFPMTSPGRSRPIKKAKAVKSKKAKITKKETHANERERVKVKREKEFRQEAIRARKFSGIETLDMGFELIECSLELRKAGKNVQN